MQHSIARSSDVCGGDAHCAAKLGLTSKMMGLMERPLSTHEQVRNVSFGKTQRFQTHKASIVPLPGASNSSFGKQACSNTAPAHSVYKSRAKRPSSANITSAHQVRYMGQTSSLGQNPPTFKRPMTASGLKRRNERLMLLLRKESDFGIRRRAICICDAQSPPA